MENYLNYLNKFINDSSGINFNDRNNDKLVINHVLETLKLFTSYYNDNLMAELADTPGGKFLLWMQKFAPLAKELGTFMDKNKKNFAKKLSGTELEKELISLTEKLNKTDSNINDKKNEIENINNTVINLNKKVLELEKKSLEWEGLVENKNKLSDRLKYLLTLQDEVKTGKIDKLAEEVKSLESTGQNIEEQKEKLSSQIQEKQVSIEKQKNEQDSLTKKLDKGIKALILFKENETIITEILEKINTRNNEIILYHKELIEPIKVHINENKNLLETLKIKGEANNLINDIQKKLIEIDKTLASKLEI